MTEQATGGGNTSPGTLCEHGLTVDGPLEGECQLCDWCPRCEMVRRFNLETCASCGYEWGTPTGRPVSMTQCTGNADLNGDVHHNNPCPVHDVRAEAAAARERVLERVEEAKATQAPPPDPVLESKDWPWYEARLSVHVRGSKPTDTFGEGGEELAHARAWTQAPSFRDAVERLDGDLAKNWTQITTNAELVDTPPSPDVLPPPLKWWDRPLEVRTVVVVYALFIALLTLLAVAVST